MLEKHQKLIQEYKNNEKSINRTKIETIIIEVLMVIIVVGMKSIQNTASLRLNFIAMSLVLILLFRHFWNFYSRRALYNKSTSIIIRGFKLENQKLFLKKSFFQNYLKEFNAIGQIIYMALFDILLIYFSSVSCTQFLKALNPEIMLKMRFITPLSTIVICFSLGWAYYKVIKPLVSLKIKKNFI